MDARVIALYSNRSMQSGEPAIETNPDAPIIAGVIPVAYCCTRASGPASAEAHPEAPLGLNLNSGRDGSKQQSRVEPLAITLVVVAGPVVSA